MEWLRKAQQKELRCDLLCLQSWGCPTLLLYKLHKLIYVYFYSWFLSTFVSSLFRIKTRSLWKLVVGRWAVYLRYNIRTLADILWCWGRRDCPQSFLVPDRPDLNILSIVLTSFGSLGQEHVFSLNFTLFYLKNEDNLSHTWNFIKWRFGIWCFWISSNFSPY